MPINPDGSCVYSNDDADRLRYLLRDVAPVVSVARDTLGGESRASLMLCIVLDPRDKWANGILENARYARFALHADRVARIECFSGGHGCAKFRAGKVRSLEHIAERLTKWATESAAMQAQAVTP
jgi:hypothetical protein